MRILVADDHGIVRSGIKLLLERQPGLDVVAEASDGVEAVEQRAGHAPGPVHPRRRHAADDRPPGRPRDPLAPEERDRADALDARRRALPVRGAQGRRLRLRAQARSRSGPGRRGVRGGTRRGVPDQRGRARDHPPLDGGRRRRPLGVAHPARGGGGQADRRGATPTRRSPRSSTWPRRPSSRTGPTCCASSGCATGWSWCGTPSAGVWSRRKGPGRMPGRGSCRARGAVSLELRSGAREARSRMRLFLGPPSAASAG